jgi:hypothetical protein
MDSQYGLLQRRQSGKGRALSVDPYGFVALRSERTARRLHLAKRHQRDGT